MCGIAGIISNQSSCSIIEPMIKAMQRRGPDDNGTWCSPDNSIVLGHTRLSIIDLSKDGHQPMHSSLKRYSIVFNGEIYNYKELKEELCQFGTKFSTFSDTEVILNAWEKWGLNTPKKLRGMFAFSIWDDELQTLTLVRDRIGIKPLLWSRTKGSFIFASSIKAMLASGLVNPILNNEALYDLMASGSVFQPRTIIKNVFALMPGTLMVVDKKSNIIEHKTYWELTPSEHLISEVSKLDYITQVIQTRKLIEDACKYHLVSDVPVGSFLSGGVDSSIITALIAKISSKPVKSFSVGFENGPDLINELSDAKNVSDYIGTEHTEVILTGVDVSKNFDDFIDSIDQPSYDGLNTYWVSRISKDYVKVALSGLGGDECFAGYNHFEWPSRFNKQITLKTRCISLLFDQIPYSRPFTVESKLENSSPIGRLSLLRKIFSDNEINKNLSALLQNNENRYWIEKYIEQLGIKNENTISEITNFEFKNYLLNTMLRDSDALSMANSIEMRPLFLDHKIVEWALALPSESKWRNGVAKSILKDVGKDLFPPEFFNRSKKGFTLPISRWLNSDLKRKFVDTLTDNNSELFFKKQFLNSLIHNVANPRKNKGAWMIFVFLNWAKKNSITLEGN
jgi:asparagine synthase (glutamine-hydrolysing)